jgi:hypothetical protein
MQTGPFSEYATAAAVTPSDTTAVSFRGVWVGGAGNLAVVTEGGNTVTFTAVPAGTLLPVAVKAVNATNTTATNIVGLA